MRRIFAGLLWAGRGFLGTLFRNSGPALTERAFYVVGTDRTRIMVVGTDRTTVTVKATITGG